MNNNNLNLLPYHLRNDDLNNFKVDNIKGFKFKKGYLSYSLMLSINEFNSKEGLIIFEKELHNLLNRLENDKIYSILVSGYTNDYNSYKNINKKAMFISKETPFDILYTYLLMLINDFEIQYNPEYTYHLVITGRIWYSKKDIKNNFLKLTNENKNITKLVEVKYNEIKSIIIKDMYSPELNNTDNFIINQLKTKFKKNCLAVISPKYIKSLHKNNIINGNYFYTSYFINFNELKNNLNLFVNNRSDITCKLILIEFHYLENISIYSLLLNGLEIYRWQDQIINKNENTAKKIIKRNSISNLNKITKDLLIYFDELTDKIIDIEVEYKFKNIVETPKDKKIDNAIGTIDIETYTIDKTGRQVIRSAGWCAENELKIYNIGDPFCLNPHDLLKTMFNDIMESKYHNYTFYVHNLSKFDSILIIDSLSRFEEFNLNLTMKDDNTLVNLNIEKNFKVESNKNIKKKIKMLDSLLMLNNSLRNLGRDFNCVVNKGIFPHKFINSSTINYIGILPNISYFDNITIIEYEDLVSEFKNKLYSIKEESDKYLKKDLLSLLEIMTKFSKIIFNKFSLNITKYKTISGLTIEIYTSNFYNLNYNLKIINGPIEQEIRKAYFGGLIHMANNGNIKVENIKAYDVNSMYPSEMLNEMPTGNPIITTDKNLYNYFGFCYAEITPPKGLDHYLIPFRDNFGNLICPDYKFTGLYSSELLKESIKYGYKININGGFKFDKCNNLFNKFVKTLFEARIKGKQNGNQTLNFIFKLLLNSLYGRMAMRNFENKLEIINKDQAQKKMLNKNILFMREINTKIIIRYNKNISTELLKAINEYTIINTNSEKKSLNKLLNKTKGISSSIPVAAFITAYGHNKLMPYKNMAGNKLFYSDTDSIYLQNPLPNELVSSTKLGAFKLEHDIIEGYFISPKLYAFKTTKNEIIIKSKGINKNKISYEDFIDLYNGKNLTIKQTVFIKDIFDGEIKIIERDYSVKNSKQ